MKHLLSKRSSGTLKRVLKDLDIQTTFSETQNIMLLEVNITLCCYEINIWWFISHCIKRIKTRAGREEFGKTGE